MIWEKRRKCCRFLNTLQGEKSQFLNTGIGKKFSSDFWEIKERYSFHSLETNCNWNSKWEPSIFLLLGESAVLAIAMENILMIESNINQNCGGDSWSFKSGRHNSSKISKCNQRLGNLLRASPGWLEKQFLWRKNDEIHLVSKTL